MLETESNKKGWIITIVGALFFFYNILQINLMTALNHEILAEFQTTTTKISLLSSWSFYANVLTILPAGLLVDRFSVKKIMMINLFVAVIGTLIFAFAPFLFIASIGRFICGITMSFGLLACLKLASYWLPSNEMARASSIIISIGMLGGVFAQVVVNLMREAFGWRAAVFFVALIGVLIALILLLVIKDAKKEEIITERAEKLSIFESLKTIMAEKQNWLSGFFICLINLPISVLGALFGISYLVQVHRLTYMASAGIISMLFIGVIVGSPIFGYLSDKLQRRKPPMILGAFLCLFLMLVILYMPNIQSGFLYLLFFLLGFTSASQVIGFPVITESNRPRVSATATGLAVLIIAGVGYGVALPLVGWILDFNLAKWAARGLEVPGAAFFRAFTVIPLGLFIGIIMAILMKETRCKSIVN